MVQLFNTVHSAADSKQVQKARKGEAAAGNYVPITAAQTWDASTNTFNNGVYLGHLASLAFSGPIDWPSVNPLNHYLFPQSLTRFPENPQSHQYGDSSLGKSLDLMWF